MNAENRCPKCDAELAANAPRGLCPACLLKGGLVTQTGETGGSGTSQDADFVPPTPAELAAYFPDLEILELVGRGGMGIVYKARQKKLDRLVALKILSPKIGQNPAFADRFAREARAMAMLSHPHVVAVYDFGQTMEGGGERGTGGGYGKNGGERRDEKDEGQGISAPVPRPPSPAPLYYFLMEFVDGLNLRQLLDGGKLPPQEALAIVPQICDALQYAHNHGVVHRDIKPENILLDKEGRVKIADFGLAKLVGGEPNEFSLTASGQLMGTFHYMAPEQFEHPKEVDHRADIYSLGVVFYQMLTGELPIGRFAPPSRKVQIDVRLDEVVLRALEKEPEQRYQQASEVKTQVETIATTPPPSGSTATPDGAKSNDEDRSFFGIPLAERRNGVRQLVSWSGMGKAFVALLVCGLLVGTIRWIAEQMRPTPPSPPTKLADSPRHVRTQPTPLPLPGRQPIVDPPRLPTQPPLLPGLPRLPAVPKESGPRLVANPAGELRALQGQWTVLGVEKGEATDKIWGANNEDFATGARFHFAGENLKIPQLGRRGGFSMYTCSVGSSMVPRWIDLYEPASNWRDLYALGVYEFDGNRLKLCLAKAIGRPLGSVKRPDQFAVPPSSGNVLLTLERYQPSADERRLRESSHWSVLTYIEDGKTIHDERSEVSGGYFKFAEYNAFYYSVTGTDGWQYVLDPTRQPKTISLITLYRRHPSDKEEKLSGIYKFDGNRLTIAYRKGDKPPEKFDSKPGSGVTLWALEANGATLPPRIDASEPDAFSRRRKAEAVASAPPFSAAGHTPGLKPPTSVFMGGWQVTDANLENFQGLAQLESLNLSNANITDAGLKILKGATNLQSLDLTFTKATDAGLVNIEGLTKLQSLSLHGLGVTDAGLEHLKRLTQLRSLDLTFAKITDAGLARLKSLPHLRSLNLAGVHQITDAGLKHLRALTELRSLNLTWSNQISDAAIRELSQALPSCGIESGRPSVLNPTSSPGRSGQPITAPAESAKVPPLVLHVAEKPNGPWIGRLSNGTAIELLAIGENDRWWQPNGAPLATPPCLLQEARPRSPEPDFTRRAFIARISGLPLSLSGMNFEVQPGSSADDRIAYQEIQKVPTRSCFSGVETGVPNAAKTVTLRWGISAGAWEDAALAVPEPEGRLIGPGSWGDRLNSLRAAKTGMRGTEQLEMPYQPQYEERAIGILRNNGFMKADFTRFQDRVVAMFESSHLAHDFREIKLQRRPYAWVEFYGVPTQWSETPIRSPSSQPNTCNVAAQAKGPWMARLSNGVSVELVGVSDEDRWWQPNGSPLAESPCQFDSKGVCDDASLVRRRFFLRLNGLPSLAAGIVGNVAPGVAPVTRATVPEHVRQAGKEVDNRVNFLAFEAFVPKASQTITALTCGVATGPWKDFTSPSVNYYPQPGYISGGVSGGGYNVSLQIHKDKDGVTAGVSVDRLETDDFRLVLITYDGRALTGPARIDHPKRQQTQTTITATFPGLTLQEIKTVNIERRLYEWACFSYVAAQLERTAKPDSVESPTATPTQKP